MAISKEKYTKEVLRINAIYSEGSDERRLAKQELWDTYEAQSFIEKGNQQTISGLQKKLAAELYAAIKDFYGGKLRSSAYRDHRVAIFRRYCTRMVELGLAKAVPSDAWIIGFSEDGIDEELKLLPAKTTGLTDEDALMLCVPLREKSKEVLFAFHSEFGIDRLKNAPDIYEGVVSSVPVIEETPVRKIVPSR